MDIPGSTTDYQSALSATPVFSDNVRDLLSIGTLSKNPTAIITVNSTADVVDDSDGVITLLKQCPKPLPMTTKLKIISKVYLRYDS